MRSMFIEKDERLSRASPPRRGARRGGWNTGSRHRAPRDWRRLLRLLLYALLGVLGGVAALAAIGLFMDHSATPPPQQAALPASPPPQNVTPPMAAPVIAPPPLPPAASQPAQIDQSDVAALRAQIREANATLAAMRAQAEQARRDLADAARARQDALAEQQRGEQAAAAATTEEKRRQAIDAEQQRARETAQAQARQTQAQQDQQHAESAWTDAERTVQMLSRRAAQGSADTQSGASPATAEPAAPQERSPPPGFLSLPQDPPASREADNAAVPTVPPLRPPAAGRPQVVLHYQTNSTTGPQLATAIAQRLLFSDFAYADTRPAPDGPAQASVRFFYPEDAVMAGRLAAMLGGTGLDFQVQDFTDRRGRATRGTLDVWLPR